MSDLKQLARELVPYLEPYLLSLRSGYVTATAYTPTMIGGTTAGTTTYTTQVGAWGRLGEFVFFTANVAWSAATGTGEIRVSLPQTAVNVAGRAYGASCWVSGITYGGGPPMPLINNNTAFVTFYTPASNAAPTVIPVEAAGQILVSGFFFITP